MAAGAVAAMRAGGGPALALKLAVAYRALDKDDDNASDGVPTAFGDEEQGGALGADQDHDKDHDKDKDGAGTGPSSGSEAEAIDAEIRRFAEVEERWARLGGESLDELVQMREVRTAAY
jgi:hypothetical protein